MVQLGASYAHVARILNCTKLTITRFKQRYSVTGRTTDIPRSGRPCVTTANENRHLRTLHLRNRFLTVMSSAVTGLGHVICCHTECLCWAHRFQHWQHRNWQCVLFSDENRFQLLRADGRTRIYQKENSSVLC